MDTCQNCKFSREIGNVNGLACHRYPATITKVEGDQVTSHVPLHNINFWCGEHKRTTKSPPLSPSN